MSPARRRLVGTSVLSGAASVLFIGVQFLPGAEPSALTVAVGLVGPAGIAGLLWAIKSGDVRELDTRTAWFRPQVEREGGDR